MGENHFMNATGLRRALLLAQATLLACFSPPSLTQGVSIPLSPSTAASVNTINNSVRYRIDAGQSRFTVRAFAGGFLSALAHDHTISIREFDGETEFTFGTVEPASLQMSIKAASLSVVDKVSENDRVKIETTMRDEVLEVSKFPEINFKSNSVSATKTGEGQYQAHISGEVSLHGVSRPITIAAQLEFGDKVLRAKGTFALKQSNFGIKPVSVAGGTIKVKDELKFTFDIVGHP
jgi:polyisoprenoid-binding protein YceI